MNKAMIISAPPRLQKVFLLVAAFAFITVNAFHLPSVTKVGYGIVQTGWRLSLSEGTNDEEEQPSASLPEEKEQNWDERFDYKIRALMGMYDPQDESKDNERQDGNILTAMIKFPAMYSFNVVGKTNGEEDLRDEFVEQVQQVVSNQVWGGKQQQQQDSSEDTNDVDEKTKFLVTPRGKKFTKISIEAMVENASMVNSIYEELDKIEFTVMRF